MGFFFFMQSCIFPFQNSLCSFLASNFLMPFFLLLGVPDLCVYTTIYHTPILCKNLVLWVMKIDSWVGYSWKGDGICVLCVCVKLCIYARFVDVYYHKMKCEKGTSISQSWTGIVPSKDTANKCLPQVHATSKKYSMFFGKDFIFKSVY